MKLPKLVTDAVTRMENGEPIYGATAWTWDRADSEDRIAVDEWIVETKHSLGMLPSTRERRFRLLVEEIYVSRNA